MGLPRGFFLQLWLLAVSLQHFDSFRVLAQGKHGPNYSTGYRFIDININNILKELFPKQ